MPTVSVLIPTYNADAHVARAIESILGQTFTDYELLICDNASTDKTVKVIASFSDPRIRLIKNQGNQGLAYSRNRLVAEAKGKYLAWLDADDISYENRLEEQVDFLEKQPEIYVLGTYIHFCDHDGKFLYTYSPPVSSPAEVHVHLFFRNCISNASVMMRNIKIYNYQEKFTPVEDYQLWSTITKKYKAAILPRYHMAYCINETGFSHRAKDKGVIALKLVYKNQLEYYGLDTNKWLDCIYLFGTHEYIYLEEAVKTQVVKNILSLFKTIWDINRTQKYFEVKACKYVLEILFKEAVSNLTYRNRLAAYFKQYPTNRIKGVYLGVFKGFKMILSFFYFKFIHED